MGEKNVRGKDKRKEEERMRVKRREGEREGAEKKSESEREKERRPHGGAAVLARSAMPRGQTAGGWGGAEALRPAPSVLPGGQDSPFPF